jgi:hypothetical protein
VPALPQEGGVEFGAPERAQRFAYRVLGRFGEIANRRPVVQVESADRLSADEVRGGERFARPGGGIPREAAPDPAASQGIRRQA